MRSLICDCDRLLKCSSKASRCPSRVRLLPLTVSALICFYGVILAKFYKQKKKLEKLREELENDFQPKLNKLKFSKLICRYFPVCIKKKQCLSDNENNDVKLKQIKTFSNTTADITITSVKSTDSDKMKTITKLAKQMAFNVSFLKSSSYVLASLFGAFSRSCVGSKIFFWFFCLKMIDTIINTLWSEITH